MSNKEGTQPSTDEDAKFELQLMQALQNPLVAAQFRDAIAPLITPLKDALCQNTAQVASLRAQLAERDEIIDNLQSHVRGLEIKIDDLEQQGRKGSIRVFGLPEDNPGTLDEKLLTLFNQNMKMVPPLNLNDIEVAHRLGRPPQQPPAQTPTVPQQGDGDVLLLLLLLLYIYMYIYMYIYVTRSHYDMRKYWFKYWHGDGTVTVRPFPASMRTQLIPLWPWKWTRLSWWSNYRCSHISMTNVRSTDSSYQIHNSQVN